MRPSDIHIEGQGEHTRTTARTDMNALGDTFDDSEETQMRALAFCFVFLRASRTPNATRLAHAVSTTGSLFLFARRDSATTVLPASVRSTQMFCVKLPYKV